MNQIIRGIVLVFFLVLSFGANAGDRTQLSLSSGESSGGRTQNNDFEKMDDLDYSLFVIQSFADSIRAGITSGEYTWEELGFTDRQVEERLHSAKVRDAIEKFVKMNDEDYSLFTVQAFADDIRAGIAKGQFVWNELSFDNSQVEERLHSAKVRDAIEKFNKMNDTGYSLLTVQYFADNIRTGIAKGEFVWNELSFNDKQVEERLHNAKVRDADAVEKFNKM